MLDPRDEKGLGVPISRSQFLHPDSSKGWQVTPFEISILDAEQDATFTTNVHLTVPFWVDSLHSPETAGAIMCFFFNFVFPCIIV